MKISCLTPSIRPEGLKPNYEALERQTFQDFEWLVEVGLPSKGHDLNAAFNRMLKRAKGELIVFFEDYTKCLDIGLHNFWEAYQKNPGTFFTAPLGKTRDWKENQWDWRAYADADVTYDRWEIDWGAAPLEGLKAIGGFDEELDKYWSCDNVNAGYRAYLHGYKFMNVVENPAVAYDHDFEFAHPFRKNFKPEFNQQRMNEFTPGVKLPYLD